MQTDLLEFTLRNLAVGLTQRLGKCRIVMIRYNWGWHLEQDRSYLQRIALMWFHHVRKVPTSLQGSPQPLSPKTSHHSDPSKEDSRQADDRSWTYQKRGISVSVMPTRWTRVLTPSTCHFPIARCHAHQVNTRVNSENMLLSNSTASTVRSFPSPESSANMVRRMGSVTFLQPSHGLNTMCFL